MSLAIIFIFSTLKKKGQENFLANQFFFLAFFWFFQKIALKKKRAKKKNIANFGRTLGVGGGTFNLRV